MTPDDKRWIINLAEIVIIALGGNAMYFRQQTANLVEDEARDDNKTDR